MKKVLRTIPCILTSLISLLAGIAFCAIEGRLLFSGELLTYAAPWFGILRAVTRLIWAVLAILIAILPWFSNKVDSEGGFITFVYVLLFASVFFGVLSVFTLNINSSNTLFSFLQGLIFIAIPILHPIFICIGILTD
ncbi:MAG: hypothetical protein J5736_00400 [Bacilli bacterium]|nr:hypothetical protein [Bacilli bacterium]